MVGCELSVRELNWLCETAMMEIDKILNSDDLRLLADIGFIAGSRGLSEYARAIFEVVRVLRPGQEAGFLGSAVVHVLSGNPGAAVKELECAPATIATKTFMGIALLQEGRLSDGSELLCEVVREAPGTAYSQLAQGVLSGACFQKASFVM